MYVTHAKKLGNVSASLKTLFCDYRGFCIWTLFRILEVREAPKQTSLAGLDNTATDGSAVFETEIKQIVDDLDQIGQEEGWSEDIKKSLQNGKQYLKTKYREHCQQRESTCPDHCVKFALSDPNDASSETQGQIVGTRESLNGRENMARRKVKNEKSPWGQCLTRPVPNSRRRSCFWLVPQNFCVFLPNQKAERRRPFGTGLVRHCLQGLFSPFFSLLRAIFSCPFRLSLAPTMCPWVSEDANDEDLQEKCKHEHTSACSHCVELSVCLDKVEQAIKGEHTQLYSKTTRRYAIWLWIGQWNLFRWDTATNRVIGFEKRAWASTSVAWYRVNVRPESSKLLLTLIWSMHPRLVRGCTNNWRSSNTRENEATRAKRCFLRSDEPGCYHSNFLIAAVRDIGQRVGVAVEAYDFSEPQSGKDVCDRTLCPLKSSVRAYCSEGNDILSASDMRDALQKHPVRATSASVNMVDESKKSLQVNKMIILAVSQFHIWELRNKSKTSLQNWSRKAFSLWHFVFKAPRRGLLWDLNSPRDCAS